MTNEDKKQNEETTNTILSGFEKAREVRESKSLSEKLKEQRKHHGLTMQEISILTGLSVSAVSRLESGQTVDPKLSTIKRLAQAYDLPYEAFIYSMATELDDLRVETKRVRMLTAKKTLEDIENDDTEF